MQAYDVKVLGDRLNELAEVFDKKPVGEKALTVWFSVLRDFPTERVCSMLIAWPRTHTKFPAPSEVWKAVNDMGIGEREDKAAKENREQFFQAPTAEGRRFMTQIRELVKRETPSPMQHWKRNLTRFPVGHIGHDYALAALKAKGVIPRERTPGEDDELAA
jgi:hypothetical protein